MEDNDENTRVDIRAERVNKLVTNISLVYCLENNNAEEKELHLVHCWGKKYQLFFTCMSQFTTVHISASTYCKNNHLFTSLFVLHFSPRRLTERQYGLEFVSAVSLYMR